ncbi:PQQ-binding-like beta-propeller repeat protein [Haloplanus sp. C73]|uniref:outer membrane protein assembly factor BamB family protein n=1 Tax=Haloplanus sp. C73 TaxID=3421641 RepID=UPI003EBDA6F8
MDRRTFLTAGCAGTAALSGCLSLLPSGRPDTPLPDTPEGSWTQRGADGATTFAPDVAAPPRGNLAWVSKAFTRWEPVIADGTVYTTNFDPSTDGSAFALDARDGSERWRTILDGDGDNASALVDGHFVVAHGTELVALDPRNGDIVWRRSVDGVATNGHFGEWLAADDRTGTVVVPYRDGLKAFRAADGDRRWETAEMARQSSKPAIRDGTVYAIGRVDGTDCLAAFALDDGRTRWTAALDAPAGADPVATDRGVLAVDGNTLVVHDPKTGNRRSETTVFEDYEMNGETTVAADDGTAFVAFDQAGLLAVDIEAGTTRQLHDDRVYGDSFAVGTESVVVAVDGSQYLDSGYGETITAFDRDTGDVRWNYVMENFHSMTILPVLVEGAVFFATSALDGLAVLGDVDAEG